MPKFLEEQIKGLIDATSKKCEETIANLEFAFNKVRMALEEERDLKIQNYLSILENLETVEIPESVAVGKDSPPRRRRKPSGDNPEEKFGSDIRTVLKAAGVPLQLREVAGVYHQLHGEQIPEGILEKQLSTLVDLGYVMRGKGRVSGQSRVYYQDASNPESVAENVRRLVAAKKAVEEG